MLQVGLRTTAGIFLALGVSTTAEAAGSTVNGKVSAKRAKNAVSAVISLEGGKSALEIPAEPVKMDQKNQTFLPFVLPVVKGTSVEFLNSDNTGHNVFSPDGEKYDLGNWGKGESRTYKFTKPGVYTQLCKMHPSMIAYIVVLDTPYFAVSKADGSFSIPDVPPGKYTVKVWHERKKAKPSTLTVVAGEQASLEIALR